MPLLVEDDAKLARTRGPEDFTGIWCAVCCPGARRRFLRALFARAAAATREGQQRRERDAQRRASPEQRNQRVVAARHCRWREGSARSRWGAALH
jgi:hypothetical protein